MARLLALLLLAGRSRFEIVLGVVTDLRAPMALDEVLLQVYRHTIRHFDGKIWAFEATGTTQDLHAVFGVSGTDVYAAGNAGVIVRSTGGAASGG